MAKTTQSTQRIAQVAAGLSVANRLNDARQVGGEIQYALIDIPITADNVQGDAIELWEFAPGTIIYPELSKFYVSDDMSSGAVTVDIGDAVDVDRYCDGANLASVGAVEFLAPAVPDAYTNRHKMVNTGVASTTTTLVKATFATLGATVEAGAFRAIIAYKNLG